MFVLLVAVAALVAYLFYRRATELFCVSVRAGRVLVLRGRIPQALLNCFADAVAKPPLPSATIRAVRTSQGARLAVAGGDEFVAQRLRNIFSLYPVSQLRAAAPLNRRTAGQWLGVAWLAWLLDRSLQR